MENIDLSESAELKLQILLLKSEKSRQEAALNQSLKELTHRLFIPDSMKKETNNEPQSDKRMILNLSKMVLNKSTDYILEQNFGQKRVLSDFVASMFVELVLSPFINEKIRAFIIEISNQVFDESEEND